MGRLISVVGNTGVGKTTFVRSLCLGTNYYVGLEQHEERPFQERFMLDKKKYALANQIDYLLLRAEQELTIRGGKVPGIQDGGLDQDFFVFTRLFYHNGYLSELEYGICERAYQVLRASLNPPDLIVWLKAPLELIAERYNRRDRRLDITQIEDLEIVAGLLEKWLTKLPADKIYILDAEKEDHNYEAAIPEVKQVIAAML